MDVEKIGIQSKLPVLIIGYARLSNIDKLIRTIFVDDGQQIFLHLDLGKSRELRERQQSFCQVIKNEFGSRIEIELCNENKGVARAVYSAISWFFSQVEVGVILEDDLVITTKTLDFFQAGIPFLRSNEKCLLISGSTFQKEDVSDWNNEVRWTNFPLIWGWATTSERWKILRELIIQPVPRRCVVSRVRGFLSIGAFQALIGAVDTWDSPMALGMWIEGYLCMAPPHNLVSNLGIDSDSTHTKEDVFPIGNPIKDFNISSIEFVEPIQKKIDRTNKEIMRQNYQLKLRHIVAPLFLRLRKENQETLRKRLLHEG